MHHVYVYALVGVMFMFVFGALSDVITLLHAVNKKLKCFTHYTHEHAASSPFSPIRGGEGHHAS